MRRGTLNARAKPKSANLMMPFVSTRRFCGLEEEMNLEDEDDRQALLQVAMDDSTAVAEE